MEGTKAVDPGEADRALTESRAALAQAAAGRGLEASEPDLLLVVKAREVARTAGRKRAQVLSVALVVVVVVAVVVAILASDRGGSRRGGGNVHQAVPAGGGRVPAWGAAPAPRFFAPRPYPPPPPVGVSVGVSVFVPLGPQPAPAPALPQADDWLAGRGWLDGDATELTVELVDPRTGEPRWRRTVQGSADPRNAAEVSALLDRALAGEAFGQRVEPLGGPGPAREVGAGAATAATAGGEPWPEAPPEAVLPPEPAP